MSFDEEYYTHLEEYYNDMIMISNRFSQLLDSSDNSIKVDFDERNDWFFYCTNKRANTFKERLTNLNSNSFHVKGKNGKIR